MNSVTKLFGYTLLISFIGTLPLGTLNVTVSQLSYRAGESSAFWFGAGAILIELFLVWLAIKCVERLKRLKRLLRIFHWVSIIILLSIGTVSLVAGFHMEVNEASVLFGSNGPFLQGILLSVLNPLHLPYWLGWTASLGAKGILKAEKNHHKIYLLAIGIGTALAFVLYGWIGSLLIALLQNKQYLVNSIVGATLIATAGIKLYRTVLSQSATGLTTNWLSKSFSNHGGLKDKTLLMKKQRKNY